MWSLVSYKVSAVNDAIFVFVLFERYVARTIFSCFQTTDEEGVPSKLLVKKKTFKCADSNSPLPFIRNTAHHSFFEMFFIDDGVIKSCKTRHMSSLKTSVFSAVFSFFFSKWDKGSMPGLSES